ncbi:hypothetical protein K432DRAFT_421928 [Lepidopterella palustris CBS 459.81]|uniref:DUF6594 domain-containing protein n=1 Tax=Lepidopterella palustris CBS 459.81 TaxID=1314670 RepID=A0A8E2EJZ8_9PEZI|nr:hypothetical protein K432DRAFT_421928 [Lepidopterella palustris CBS 459.81]
MLISPPRVLRTLSWPEKCIQRPYDQRKIAALRQCTKARAYDGEEGSDQLYNSMRLLRAPPCAAIQSHEFATMPRQASPFDLSENANWMTQDRDLWLFRRYEKLHIFNILSLQQRLATLEQQLERNVDAEWRGEGEQRAAVGCLPKSQDNALVTEIQTAVKAYDEALLALAEISRFQCPAVRTVKIVEKTMYHTNVTTLARELGINQQGADRTTLLAIATPAKSWFHKYIDKSEWLSSLFTEASACQGHQKINENDLFYKYSESKIRKAEFGMISASLCLVQILPIAALTLVTNRTWRLVIMLFLILIVSILTSLFANTARATNFGAVVAYSALIIVFLGKGN